MNTASKLFTTLLLFLATVTLHAQLTIQSVDVSGDSISKGFNATSAFPCQNADQENYNWLTSRTHGTSFCSPGSENVFSVVEQMECDAGASIFTPSPNHAVSGATLVRDFAVQAQNVRTYLASQPAGRLAVVFLGHNDNCSGTAAKVNASCASSDLDPANYCKTLPDSFERELRKGLDILMSTPDTRVGVMSPVRVSQLCNFGAKANCQLSGTCQFLWGVVNICAPLTRDCSSARIIDTYTTLKAYHDILRDVTAEYDAIRPGGHSRIVDIGGQTVGGGQKAPGVDLIFSDGPWYYRFNSNQISCCDCFHPSAVGQDKLGHLMKSGLACSRLNPCCKDTGDPLADGRCTATTRKRIVYRGLL
jgi:hypothetical protein